MGKRRGLPGEAEDAIPSFEMSIAIGRQGKNYGVRAERMLVSEDETSAVGLGKGLRESNKLMG